MVFQRFSGVKESPTAYSEPQLTANHVYDRRETRGSHWLCERSRRLEDLLSAAGAVVVHPQEFQETPGTTCPSASEAVSFMWTFKLRVQPPEIVLFLSSAKLDLRREVTSRLWPKYWNHHVLCREFEWSLGGSLLYELGNETLKVRTS